MRGIQRPLFALDNYACTAIPVVAYVGTGPAIRTPVVVDNAVLFIEVQLSSKTCPTVNDAAKATHCAGTAVAIFELMKREFMTRNIRSTSVAFAP